MGKNFEQWLNNLEEVIEKTKNKAQQEKKEVIITEADINVHMKRKEELETKQKELENKHKELAQIQKQGNNNKIEILQKEIDNLEQEINSLKSAIKTFESQITPDTKVI